MDDKKGELLRSLPSIDAVLRADAVRSIGGNVLPSILTSAARSVVDDLRRSIEAGNSVNTAIEAISALVAKRVSGLLGQRVKRVVNATGTILHTNLGRAALADEAITALNNATGYACVEYDVDETRRGERDSAVEELIKELTGAEAACVVNNNAGAVFLTLNTLALGKDVVISRGELIEIGGSFRLPEIIERSGCNLREVGTTNRTHLKDYTGAINDSTALFLKAHTSNYTVVGFTSECTLMELVKAGSAHGIPVVEDLGSGALIDLSAYGLPREPLVKESIEAGASVVTFSADKLLGGPQAGIIAGRKDAIDRVRKNPLKRVLRADKLTLSALEATLRLYLDPTSLPDKLPTLKYLTMGKDEIRSNAERAGRLIKEVLTQNSGYSVSVVECSSVVGGGAMPNHLLPSAGLSITHAQMSAREIERIFLGSYLPIVGRICNDAFTLDMRCVDDPIEVVPRA